MKSVIKQSDKKAAFTIVELLTVMSIIVILIGLLVPALNKVRMYSREVRQKAQFHSMDSAIELYNTEFEGYPPSDALDCANPAVPYCGAMKLSEAMMGQDLMGFHPNSLFRADGTNGATPPFEFYTPETQSARVGTYLPLESANAFKISQIYGSKGTFTFDSYVLCDVYAKASAGGLKTGMPILYYKANTSKSAHDAATPTNDIYNYLDNDQLVQLGIPGESYAHPMASVGTTRYDKSGGGKYASDPRIFYEHTSSEQIQASSQGLMRPYRADSYILQSAGNDGEYGTRDDIYNFDKSLVDFVDYERTHP